MKFFLFSLAFLLSSFLAVPAQARMSAPRSVNDVAWAIGKSRPSLPLAQRKAWAKGVIEEATEHNFDPFTLVAIAHNESRWNPGVIGGMQKQCVGLGQTCLHRFPACKSSFNSPGCDVHRQRLLHWRNAVAQIGADISQWRKLCKRITGKSALFARWLSGYQGVDAVRGTTCGQKKDRRGRWRDAPQAKLTRKVMNYRLKLIRWLKQERRRRR